MKTAEQEKLEGNPGRRPENKNIAKPDRNIPDPPKFLGRVAKRHYYELIKKFGPEGMRTAAASDAPYLALIAEAYADFRKATDVLTSEGEYIRKYDYVITGDVDKDGNDIKERIIVGVKKHPAVSVKLDAQKLVMLGYGKMGGSAYDRKNVNAIELLPEETQDEKRARRRAEASKKAKKLAENKKHILKVANE